MSSERAPVALPGTELRLLTSTIVGETYRLYVALPAGYGACGRIYPVIYLTDAYALFPLVKFIAEGLASGLEIPRSILVGIGPDTDVSREQADRRERDLLPTNASAGDASYRQEFTRTHVRRGQAGVFLRLIREELKPFVNAEYRTDPDDSTHVGSSYGGLFGLYILFLRPDTFNRYVIGSPAIHHDDRVLLAFEREYAAQHDDLPVRVFLSVGALEESGDPLIHPSFQFVSNVKTLAGTLEERCYPNLQLTTHIFEDESHVSVIPATLAAACGWCSVDHGPHGP